MLHCLFPELMTRCNHLEPAAQCNRRSSQVVTLTMGFWMNFTLQTPRITIGRFFLVPSSARGILIHHQQHQIALHNGQSNRLVFDRALRASVPLFPWCLTPEQF